MGLKINMILVLENDEQYITLKEAMLHGKKYFLAMGLNQNKQVLPDKIVILEEHVSGFDTYVSKVIQSELLMDLTRIFKAQV